MSVQAHRELYPHHIGPQGRIAWSVLLPMLATTALTSPAYAQNATPIDQASSAMASAASAAQPEALGTANAPAPGEIVVTAERRETSLMAVPMSMQVFSGKKLQDLHISSVKDLTLIAPGFSVAQSYQGAPQYSIRGIGFHGPNITSTPTVTLYQDQIAYPYPFTQAGPVFDIARVEVLKGPQGTLYGRNTTAGVISLISGQPTDTFKGSLATEIGNYQTLNYEGFVSGPINSWLKGRIAFRTENSFKGWQISNTRPNDRLGQVHNTGIRGILAADPAPDLKINLSAAGWHNDSDTRAGQAIALTPWVSAPGIALGSQQAANNDPAILNFIETNPFTRNNQAGWNSAAERSADQPLGATGLSGKLKENSSFYTIGLNISYDISDKLQLISISSYQHLNRKSLQDVSGVPYELLIQQPTGKIKSWSQELRLQGDVGPFKWSVGGYYAEDRMKEQVRSLIGDNANALAIRNNAALAAFTVPGGLSIFNYPQSIVQTYQQYLDNNIGNFLTGDPPLKDLTGLFRTLIDEANYQTRTRSLLANVDWKISDTLSLTLGGRYTQDHLGFQGCTRDFQGNDVIGINSSAIVLAEAVFPPVGPPATPAQPGECITATNIPNPYTAAGSTTKTLSSVRQLVDNDLNQHNWSWRAALTYRPTQQLTFYASATQGAKAGNNPLNTASNAIQDVPVKQEILRSYEAGVRTDFGKVHFSLGGFYYDYKNKQEYGFYKDVVFGVLARLLNIPHSRAYGVESDVSIQPVQGLSIFGNALYLNTKINHFLTQDESGSNTLTDVDGNKFAYSPSWAASGGGSYETTLGSSDFGLRGTVNYRWQSTSFANFSNDPIYRIKPYGLLEASVSFYRARDNRWDLSLWGKNLTNTYFAESIFANSNTIVEIPGLARTFGGTIRVNF